MWRDILEIIKKKENMERYKQKNLYNEKYMKNYTQIDTNKQTYRGKNILKNENRRIYK